MKKIPYMAIAVAALLSSCSDFLGKHPSDQSYINSTTDLKEILLGEAYQSPSGGTDIGSWLHLMDDDVQMVVSNTTMRPATVNFFWWEPNVDTYSTWTNLYKRINTANGILEEVERFPGEALYARVKGEALFLRAANYFFLVNIYAAPYEAATASAELGVPLKLTSQVQNQRFERATLAACYEQIVDDLTTAVACLKGLKSEGGNKYRAGEMAARMLLSRVYLYMGQWEESEEQSTAVIESGDYSLADFRELVSGSDAVYLNSPETIFSSGAMLTNGSEFGEMSNPRYTYSDELWASYETGDNRAEVFRHGINPQFRVMKKADNQSGGGVMSDYFAMRLPEALLNRAEARAMQNDNTALADLNTLREMRFTGTYTPLSGLEGLALVNAVRAERRRELCFEGHRWFDLRRYAVTTTHSMQKQIRHPYGLGNVMNNELVLDIYDNDSEYYVMPLPEDEIQKNGGLLKQNPIRELKTPTTR